MLLPSCHDSETQFLSCASRLFIEKLPQHRDYKTAVLPEKRETMKVSGDIAETSVVAVRNVVGFHGSGMSDPHKQALALDRGFGFFLPHCTCAALAVIAQFTFCWALESPFFSLKPPDF